MHFAQVSATVHFCWLTAQLYEQQTFTGAFPVPQACCEPGLQSSTGLREMHCALGTAAKYWCWLTAHLYEQQTFTCVFQAHSMLVALEIHL